MLRLIFCPIQGTQLCVNFNCIFRETCNFIYLLQCSFTINIICRRISFKCLHLRPSGKRTYMKFSSSYSRTLEFKNVCRQKIWKIKKATFLFLFLCLYLIIYTVQNHRVFSVYIKWKEISKDLFKSRNIEIEHFYFQINIFEYVAL